MMQKSTMVIEPNDEHAATSAKDLWAIRSVVADAHRQAREIIDEAKAKRDDLIEQARAEVALIDARRPDPSSRPITPIHSSEIAARTFPKAFRGLDKSAVYEWLSMAQASHATLEEELDRLRTAWDEILVALTRLESHPERFALAEVLAAGRPDPAVSSVDTSAVRETLTGPIRSVRKARASLASARLQLARLQHRAALLQRSNEQLRTQLLKTLAKACP